MENRWGWKTHEIETKVLRSQGFNLMIWYKCIIILCKTTMTQQGINRQTNQGKTQNRWKQSGNTSVSGQVQRESTETKAHDVNPKQKQHENSTCCTERESVTHLHLCCNSYIYVKTLG